MRYLLSVALFLTWFGISFAQVRRVDDAALKNAAKSASDGDWLSYGLTPGETRFSPLKQIDASNVKRLGLVWSYEVGDGGGDQEATPLVWNDTIFGVTNWSIVFAVDARTGKPKWRWDPEVNRKATSDKMCCGVVNRGLALYNGKIYVIGDRDIPSTVQEYDPVANTWTTRTSDPIGRQAPAVIATGDGKVYVIGSNVVGLFGDSNVAQSVASLDDAAILAGVGVQATSIRADAQVACAETAEARGSSTIVGLTVGGVPVDVTGEVGQEIAAPSKSKTTNVR